MSIVQCLSLSVFANQNFLCRNVIRQPMAEFAGVAIFVMFGTAVDCQVVLSTNPGVAASPKGVRAPR